MAGKGTNEPIQVPPETEREKEANRNPVLPPGAPNPAPKRADEILKRLGKEVPPPEGGGPEQQR